MAGDSSGNGRNGTLVNNPVWTIGKIGGALQFDGNASYVSVGDIPAPTSLTLEAWIFPGTATGGDHIILSKNNSEYDFRLLNEGTLSGSAGGNALTDTSFNFYDAAHANQWYHVVYTFDKAAGVHALYRNGVLVASGANTTSIVDTSTPLWIGRQSQYNFGSFLGKIDSVRIYSRALTASEVLANYNGG